MVNPASQSLAVLPGLRHIIAQTGKAVSWLTLLMVLLTFSIVILRYGFNLGWIWLQELLTYLHVAVFSIAAAWTLQDNGHVRVDIFYADMPVKRRALVDLLGTLIFLLPFCLFLIVVGTPYVADAWILLEGSREAGGLPLVFLLKSLILILPILLLGQALIVIMESWQTLKEPETSSRS